MMTAYPYQKPDDLYIPEDEFDVAIHDCLHLVMDRLIAAGSSCEAHADVLDIEAEDQPDAASSLLQAQLGVQGGESELDLLSTLLQIMSHLLIVRQSRSIILDKKPSESLASN